MLGAAGVLGQEILNPSINWYTEAALPQNLPAPFTNVNFGGLLAIEFLLMHWVEVRRWQDIRKFGSVNEVCAAARWQTDEMLWGRHGDRMRAALAYQWLWIQDAVSGLARL
jgi:hypothetical protein